MLAAVTKPLRDAVAAKSPWNTQVVVDNQCSTPLRVYLARDSETPSVKNSVVHSVPPQSSYALHSGWLQEPLATLIMRTGVDEAKVFRMPHMAELKVELAPTGLKVTSTDSIVVEDYADAGSVINNDTIPMVLREESFMDRKPSSEEPDVIRQASAKSTRSMGKLQDQLTAKSPWNTQIVIDNECSTPVRVYLARNSQEPSVKDSIDHSAPARSSYVIHSGWLQEPTATLIIRTGVHEAKIYRMPHMSHLKVELAPTGLKVTSIDEVIVEDYSDPGAVPNNDTVPMVLKEESFMDRRPGGPDARRAVSSVSDWSGSSSKVATMSEAPPQFSQSQKEKAESEPVVPEPTVHGKPLVGTSC